MSRRLPFEAARAFLYAAESGSFVGAADRLQVTAGAISQRIQALETFTGETLFERAAAGIRLTAAGRRLYEALREPLHGVEAALTRPRAVDSRRRLSVSVAPGFAARLLMPRLTEFSTRHPDIEICIDADPRVVRFDGPVPDLAIRYGLAGEHGLEMVELYRPHVIPCAAPGFLDRSGGVTRPQDLRDLPLLRHGNQRQWDHWLERHGMHADDMQWGAWYSDDILLREALLAGQGIGLAREPFVREDLDHARLVQVFDAWLPEEAYWLVGPLGVFDRSAPATFRDWLKEVLENGRYESGPDAPS